jgi:hypothetical protein
MHHCLEVQEILKEIFSHVLERESGNYAAPAQQSTLAALARMCKAFYEPAIDVLWSEQNLGLMPLLATIPGLKLIRQPGQAHTNYPGWVSLYQTYACDLY